MEAFFPPGATPFFPPPPRARRTPPLFFSRARLSHVTNDPENNDFSSFSFKERDFPPFHLIWIFLFYSAMIALTLFPPQRLENSILFPIRHFDGMVSFFLLLFRTRKIVNSHKPAG